MHHRDDDKTYRKKALQDLHKNATSYIERILEAMPHETTVQPLTSYLQNYPSKTNKARGTQLEKQGRAHK